MEQLLKQAVALIPGDPSCDKRSTKSRFILCMAFTMIWGLVTHAYMYFGQAFSHDSLYGLGTSASYIRTMLGLGRFLVPLYDSVFRSSISAPWLVGILALFWIALAVFLVTKLFEIRSMAMCCLTAGIFVANLTVIAQTATYILELDVDMFALLAAVVTAYFWNRFTAQQWWALALGAAFCAVSLGVYQSYVSVAISLMMLVLIMQIADGCDFCYVFKRGLRALLVLASGGAAYFVMLQIVPRITKISLTHGKYNSLDSVLDTPPLEVAASIPKAALETLDEVFHSLSSYSEGFSFALHIAMLLVIGLFVVLVLCKKTPLAEKLLLLALILLLPLGMNVVYVLTDGMTHDPMHYAFWLFYLFVLLAARWLKRHLSGKHIVLRKPMSIISALLVFIVLWGNVRTANIVYLKKALEQQATLSLLSRVVYSMEQIEGYVEGETPVTFVGRPKSLQDKKNSFKKYYQLTGNSNGYSLGSASREKYQLYFTYVLKNPTVMTEQDVWDELKISPEVAEMPCYPEAGSIELIGDVLVVKLG